MFILRKKNEIDETKEPRLQEILFVIKNHF